MKQFAYFALFSLLASSCSPVKVKNDGGDDGADASTVDGGGDVADAGEPDAIGPGMVTVTVHGADTAVEMGRMVVFSNPDGTLISTKNTDANGQATEIVPTDAIVTVGEIRGDGDGGFDYTIKTIYGVQPGDSLVIGPNKLRGTGDSLGMGDINVASGVSGAIRYRFGTNCDSTFINAGQSPPITLQYFFYNNDCSGDSTNYDLLGVAYEDDQELVPLQWTLVASAQPGVTTNIGAWTNFADLTINANNAPFAGTIRDVNIDVYRRGIEYYVTQSPADVSVGMGGNAVIDGKIPVAFADNVQVKLEMNNTLNNDLVLYSTNITPSTSTVTADLGGLGYPAFTNVALDTSVPARPAVRWNQSGAAPARAEAILSANVWVSMTGDETWVWAIVAPADSGSPLQIPALPPAIANDGISDRWPLPSNVTAVQNVIGLLERGDRADWDDLRQNRPLDVFGNGDFLSEDAPTGSVSALRVGGSFPSN